MNLKDAYSILEIPQGTSPEDAKKKYRELTKKLHPDVNKEPDAEAKFKKINEAYQVVSTGKGTDRELRAPRQQHPFGRHFVQAEPINLSTTISFKESVLGCSKELKFNRTAKCKPCNGNGETGVNNGCPKCGGQGQVVGRQGNIIIVQTCDKCFGKTNVVDCPACSGNGLVQTEASMSVTIPAGRQNGDILRLLGMGHYCGNFGPMEQYSDAFLRINVISEPGLSLDGANVVSILQISLLEALQGCQKTINTIDGYKEIEVKSLSRNKEEVIIPKMGVNRFGDQRVILDVKYPDNSTYLINILSKSIKEI